MLSFKVFLNSLTWIYCSSSAPIKLLFENILTFFHNKTLQLLKGTNGIQTDKMFSLIWLQKYKMLQVFVKNLKFQILQHIKSWCNYVPFPKCVYLKQSPCSALWTSKRVHSQFKFCRKANFEINFDTYFSGVHTDNFVCERCTNHTFIQLLSFRCPRRDR